MRQFYEPVDMRESTLAIVQIANGLLREYARQGYKVTLRQLYYQYISHDLFPATWIDRAYNLAHNLEPDTKNTVKNYKRLGSILDNGRKCGLIDWDLMVDLGRDCEQNPAWDSMQNIIESCAAQFQYRTWDNQPWHVEVMVEKQALEGVLLPVCKLLDIPFSANKGYSSSSSMREAGQRIKGKLDAGKNIAVLYLGDHDPSGLDMSRDVEDRLKVYSEFMFWSPKSEKGTAEYKKAVETKNPRYFKKYYNADYTSGANKRQFIIDRLALNMDQVNKYRCPPNPAKTTDARFAKYQEEYGDDSWELDALSPSVLDTLVRAHVAQYRDDDLYRKALERQQWARETIGAIAHEVPEEPDEVDFNTDDYPISDEIDESIFEVPSDGD